MHIVIFVVEVFVRIVSNLVNVEDIYVICVELGKYTRIIARFGDSDLS